MAIITPFKYKKTMDSNEFWHQNNVTILSIANDLEDMKSRISKMIVAYNKSGEEITTKDLEVDGAMTAIMKESFNPNLIQTIEGNPVLVHAGPFANIAIGQSSVIADKIGIKLSDYLVTESGFGADIGYNIQGGCYCINCSCTQNAWRQKLNSKIR